MDPERLYGHKDDPIKIVRPQRWDQNDENGGKGGEFGAYRTQEAGFPRKLALWISKAGFSYMHQLG